MDEIVYWMGTPLSDVPREELEQALIDTHRQLEETRQRAAASSVGEVRALAELGRERLKPPLLKLLGFA